MIGQQFWLSLKRFMMVFFQFLGMDSEEQVTYRSYLMLHKGNGILGCQKTTSKRPETDDEKAGEVAKIYKNEHLFIVTHQAFELWFKQIVEEFGFLIPFFKKLGCEPAGVLVSDGNNSLDRINKILKVVVQHFEILETMRPGEFLEFRHNLKSGSGFQSLQFREIEIKLGVEKEKRVKNAGKDYKCSFENDEIKDLERMEAEDNLIGAVQMWLEHVFEEHPKFWPAYTEKCRKFDIDVCKKDKAETLANLEDKAHYKKSVGQRFSYNAFRGALLVSLYKDESSFQQLYQLLYQLMDLDALVSRWRSIHVLMVHRMIGSKIGTGGSSGVEYLADTTKTDTYRVFWDLFNLSTFFIRTEFLPAFKDVCSTGKK